MPLSHRGEGGGCHGGGGCLQPSHARPQASGTAGSVLKSSFMPRLEAGHFIDSERECVCVCVCVCVFHRNCVPGGGGFYLFGHLIFSELPILYPHGGDMDRHITVTGALGNIIV